MEYINKIINNNKDPIYLIIGVINISAGIIPIYCWISLFISIPLFFILPYFTYYVYIHGIKLFNIYDITTIVIETTIVTWLLLPLGIFIGLFAEIILIPSFLLALPTNLSITSFIIWFYYYATNQTIIYWKY